MTFKVGIINGKAPSGGNGGVSDADLSNIAVNFLNPGIVATNDFKVEEQGTPNMTVKVNTGKAYIANSAGSMMYVANLDASVNATIASNASGNPRIDAVVIKLDLSVTPDLNAANVASIVVVQGTPAASPSAPNDAAIQTAVGAGNPFYRLANVAVANGAASITNANITSTRSIVSFKNIQAGQTSSAKVYNSANQSTSASTETALTFNTEDWDTDSIHDTSSNTSRLTLPTSGKWLLIGQVTWAASGGGTRYGLIKKNGSTDMAKVHANPNGSFDHSIQVQLIVNASAGDYFELYGYQNAGTLNVMAGAAITFFECHKLSP